MTEQPGPEVFDRLMDLNGEDFKRGVLGCLKLIYCYQLSLDRMITEALEALHDKCPQDRVH
jgi:hypothetical protein